MAQQPRNTTSGKATNGKSDGDKPAAEESGRRRNSGGRKRATSGSAANRGKAPDQPRAAIIGSNRIPFGKAGGAYPVIFNAANEVAVAAFLGHSLAFMDIPPAIRGPKPMEKRGTAISTAFAASR